MNISLINLSYIAPGGNGRWNCSLSLVVISFYKPAPWGPPLGAPRLIRVGYTAPSPRP